MINILQTVPSVVVVGVVVVVVGVVVVAELVVVVVSAGKPKRKKIHQSYYPSVFSKDTTR